MTPDTGFSPGAITQFQPPLSKVIQSLLYFLKYDTLEYEQIFDERMIPYSYMAVDPAFGLPAVWIEERQKEMAQMSGFTVVDCSTVVATHLSHLMQVHAAKLLGRVETQALVEHLTKQAPQLIEDVIPKMVSIATLQRVLQLLLEEGVHVRDMRSIVECLAENAATVTDPMELARRIRTHIAPAIDPAFLSDAQQVGVAIDPISGADLTAVVKKIFETPANLVEQARTAVNN